MASDFADMPEGLNDVLLIALAKETGDRYDSVIYLRDDLQALLDRTSDRYLSVPSTTLMLSLPP